MPYLISLLLLVLLLAWWGRSFLPRDFNLRAANGRLLSALVGEAASGRLPAGPGVPPGLPGVRARVRPRFHRTCS
jgi:hypothetical protein